MPPFAPAFAAIPLVEFFSGISAIWLPAAIATARCTSMSLPSSISADGWGTIRSTEHRSDGLFGGTFRAVNAVGRQLTTSTMRGRPCTGCLRCWNQQGLQGRPLPYSTVSGTFRYLRTKLRWRSNGVLPQPRIHDLRHGFACRRLLRWYREGVPIDQAIAALSTYLGHGKVSDTYWYLSGTAELLSIAGQRFERFVALGRRQP